MRSNTLGLDREIFLVDSDVVLRRLLMVRAGKAESRPKVHWFINGQGVLDASFDLPRHKFNGYRYQESYGIMWLRSIKQELYWNGFLSRDASMQVKIT